MKKQNIVAITFIALLISTLNINLLAQCVDCDANSSASGSYASAMGMSANATGQASLAVGLEAYADGNYSFAPQPALCVLAQRLGKGNVINTKSPEA
ncbi:MAG: hypothetical protein R2750_00175 [Bacteroidales bacterium]